MGKKQHSKDRMFITKTEWATEGGGAKSKELRTAPFKPLSFHCRALTFTPFGDDPVCTKDGSVFDITQIMRYIKKHKKNLVTGAPLTQKDLIPLKFHKNAEGEYHCPVLNKVFTEHTHILAVRTTGNVFCYQAIEELNMKTKYWRELLTNEPFTMDDLITIQNPNAPESRNLVDFDHIKNSLKMDDDDLKTDTSYSINATGDMKQMLKELGTEKGKEIAEYGGGGSKARNERAAALEAVLAEKPRIKEDSSDSVKPKQTYSVVGAASASLQGRSSSAAKSGTSVNSNARVALHMAGERAPVNAKLVKSHYTTGAASRSFTSTAYDPVTKNEYEYVKVEKNPTKKGYVRLHTTHGDLNIELHCDLAPRACENFITLCERGYYNGIVFHISIKNFMIQGGDLKGTGEGEESIWGKPFKDELNSKLVHSQRGVVSMANFGPHSNGSHFFILYKSAPHLINKHSVFGGVVGGLTTLSAMEKVSVDGNDRPLEEIKIIEVEVFVNPYTELDEEEEKKSLEENKIVDEDRDKIGSWYSNPRSGVTGRESSGDGVGKYFKPKNAHAVSIAALSRDPHPLSVAKKRKVGGESTTEFKNFTS